MDWKTVLGFTVLFHGLVYAWRREWVLRLDTRKLNSTINGLGTHHVRKYFRFWFRIGSYATIIIGFPFTFFLFLRTIFYSIFPSIVAVAIAVTPTALVPGLGQDSSLELHHDQLAPYPDADLPVESDSDKNVDSYSFDQSTYLAIQPILPGWNLPITHLPYYLLAILISVVIHELGHAVASAAHKVPIQSVGVSIFGPLIPAAHVELNSTQLRETPIKKQLDILTAGVWMNLYLALITYFVVPKMLPAMLWPTHGMGGGISVTGIRESSGIGGPGGLDLGDVIIGIENCPVKDLDSWYTCLEKIWQSDPVGYCISNDTLSKFANNSEGCCDSNGDNSPTHLCFLQMDTSPIEKDKALSSNSNSNPNGSISPEDTPGDKDHPLTSALLSVKPQNRTSFCLPAQPVVAAAPPPSMLSESSEHLSESVFTGWEGRCHSPLYSCASLSVTLDLEDTKPDPEVEKDHAEDTDIKNLHPLIEESHCFLPRLVRDLVRFRIVVIQRRQEEEKSSVLFVGNVMDLYNGLRTTEFIPRTWFLSKLFGFSAFARLPEKLETVLLLTAGLSAGLAVVNMLPIYGLDGYHIVDAMARAYFNKRWENRQISRLVQVISWIALVIAMLTVFCSVAQAL